MSAHGRGVAIVLMLTGIAVFGAVTASVAAYLVETDVPDGLDEINARLARIEEILARPDTRPATEPSSPSTT